MITYDVELSVDQAAGLLRQILDQAIPSLVVVGEVANFQISKQKWVYFDLKGDENRLNCFMTIYQLRTQIADGMMVQVVARPSLTKWGKLSLVVSAVKPVGEGSIKKSFELLRAKLTKEGLFAPERKRPLPVLPEHIGVISSTEAAGYKDFIKIICARMGGLNIDVISVQVQGQGSADQMIAAIEQFNQSAHPPQVLAILRGGGSRDDLAAFDDERLVRAIAGSRIPVIAGVGHEVDVTLADLVADVRASTPSNAAEILVPDRRELEQVAVSKLTNIVGAIEMAVKGQHNQLEITSQQLVNAVDRQMVAYQSHLRELSRTLGSYNPRSVLARGYAMIWNNQHRLPKKLMAGDEVIIETDKQLINAEVKNVNSKENE